jgi:hypothetical protein
MNSAKGAAGEGVFRAAVDGLFRSPRTFDGSVLARDYGLQNASESEMRALSQMHSFLDEPSPGGISRGWHSHAIAAVSHKLDLPDTRDALRVYQSATENGLVLKGTGDRNALVNLLRGYQSKDPDLWNGLVLARDYGLRDASDSEVRALSQMHRFLDEPPPGGISRGWYSHAMAEVSHKLDLPDTKDVLRVYQNATENGLVLEGTGNRKALIDLLRGHLGGG